MTEKKKQIVYDGEKETINLTDKKKVGGTKKKMKHFWLMKKEGE